jgi:dihydrofolate synthase/folylpolyglutamate synthase
MTYKETVDYLYAQLPAFQNLGKKAIRPNFDNILKLCECVGNPHEKIRTIHVAGTNGKGSSSHMIASVLQENGYKTGLYTSPHLKDFRERFRINGEMPSETFVIDFVESQKEVLQEIKPSFFELTVVLAFHYFAINHVDIAVIEVGLGGRLDSTNIIRPEICLITNIGYDHTDILGDTLESIAFEKAGIIKQNTPVIISEFLDETAPVFIEIAKIKNAPVFFAKDHVKIRKQKTNYLVNIDSGRKEWEINLDLKGHYQEKNLAGVCCLLTELAKLGFRLEDDKIILGLENTIRNTGLKGRWQKLGENPLIICDTGHNEQAFGLLREELNNWKPEDCHFILAFAKDKDLVTTLGVLPPNSNYYFTEFDSPRAAKKEDLIRFANYINILKCKSFADVNQAIAHVKRIAKPDQFIYVGGSTYLVAEINEL